ncbi:hypothetical protein CPB84DRAFT_1760154 [Gymnopilus junonius]|uniref:Protein YOP1 n=1 Tax=Gymnopilus junonius TaxID=109634 RepID=A0A9P5P124_GYMJU|nr:hypothetical protein CPB84DRAFT_1760154 [Gymnopilus junonius]
MAVESVAEWLVSWLPFYWELKTVFLLFLALPQTEGTTYIYNACLQPFFSRNEAEFDAGIIRIQQNVLSFLQEKLTGLWNSIWAISTRNPQSHAASPAAAAGSQWSWLLSADAWRSALNVLQPTTNPSSTAPPSRPQNARSSSSNNSRQEVAGKQPLPFPVPQR